MTKKRHRKIWDYQDDDCVNAASFTEWTGGIPVKPSDPAQFRSYDELLPTRLNTVPDEDVPEEK